MEDTLEVTRWQSVSWVLVHVWYRYRFSFAKHTVNAPHDCRAQDMSMAHTLEMVR